MQSATRESSILTSLSELRAIEHQRIADERAAQIAAEVARKAELAAAERLARERVEAAVRAEHEAAIAREHARQAAEREERLRIDAAAAAELARGQVALAEFRTAQELALRREEVARKRPTWMVAVTALAVAGAGVLLWFALGHMRASHQALDQARAAERERVAARQAAIAASANLDRLQGELDQFERQLAQSTQALLDAQTAADRRAAADRVHRLNQEQARIRADVERARREKELRERREGVKVNEACLKNSLC